LDIETVRLVKLREFAQVPVYGVYGFGAIEWLYVDLNRRAKIRNWIGVLS
jgi:hypothetical protein